MFSIALSRDMLHHFPCSSELEGADFKTKSVGSRALFLVVGFYPLIALEGDQGLEHREMRVSPPNCSLSLRQWLCSSPKTLCSVLTH